MWFQVKLDRTVLCVINQICHERILEHLPFEQSGVLHSSASTRLSHLLEPEMFTTKHIR